MYINAMWKFICTLIKSLVEIRRYKNDFSELGHATTF